MLITMEPIARFHEETPGYPFERFISDVGGRFLFKNLFDREIKFQLWLISWDLFGNVGWIFRILHQ